MFLALKEKYLELLSDLTLFLMAQGGEILNKTFGKILYMRVWQTFPVAKETFPDSKASQLTEGREWLCSKNALFTAS